MAARPTRRRNSTVPSTTIASATASNTIGGANQTSAMTRTTRTEPLMARVIRLRPPGYGAISLDGQSDGCRLDPAVAALPLLIRDHRFEEMPAAEIGPQ